MIGVLIGDASTCRKASATAVSSAVLFDSVFAPICNGSDGVTDTGPYSCVCVSVASGWSCGVGCAMCTPQPAVGEVPYLMLALMKEPSVYMSVRVFGVMSGRSLKGVAVGASDSGRASSMECSEGVLFTREAYSGDVAGLRGGVAGARKRRGRSPSICRNRPLPPPHPAEVRVVGGSGVGGAVRGVVGGDEFGGV